LADIQLTKAYQLEWKDLAGGVKYKFIATGDKFMTGIGIARPRSGETWHKHTENVEETYYVLNGQGTISWKSDGGEVRSLEFSAGDALYLPYGIENEFVNTGDDELRLLFNITRAEKLRE
jgi:mannose-6-phosphate isomerase-like protein (cupin superfamily)